MPKRIIKAKAQKPINRKFHWALGLLLVSSVIIAGTVIAKRQLKQAEIFEVSQIPVVTSTPSPINCTSQIKSLEVSVPCGKQSYKQISYQCQTGAKIRLATGNTCVDYLNAYREAEAKCGLKCSSPKPIPSGTAYPSPSIITSPRPSSSAILSCGFVTHFAYREICGTGMYRYIDFTCPGDTQPRSLGGSSSCKPGETWQAEAALVCKSLCLRVSPVPTNVPYPVQSVY